MVRINKQEKEMIDRYMFEACFATDIDTLYNDMKVGSLTAKASLITDLLCDFIEGNINKKVFVLGLCKLTTHKVDNFELLKSIKIFEKFKDNKIRTGSIFGKDKQEDYRSGRQCRI